MYRIGVDLGGTNIAVGLVNDDMKIQVKKSLPTGASRPAEEIVADIATLCQAVCDEAGIEHFSMHVLRHTYATRAIERGVQPKVLQKLLGHASIQTTMDKYVHVTDDSMANAIRQFEGAISPKTDEIWEEDYT